MAQALRKKKALGLISAPKYTVGLIFKSSNSHGVGYDAPLAGDIFDAKVYEWSQAGKLLPPVGAQLDDGDTAAPVTPRYTQYLNFLNSLAAKRPDLKKIIVVPQGQGATGFVVGPSQTNADTWNANPAMQPNRLTAAKTRWEACYAAELALGHKIEVICGIHISSLPDVDVSVTSAILAKQNAYADNMDAFIDWCRANLSGFNTQTPMIVSNGMNITQYNGLAADGQTFCSAGHGVPYRRAYAHMIDPIFTRGDGEAANLPVPTRAMNVGDTSGDTTHASRTGDSTKGRLNIASLEKAKANVPSKLKAPFNNFGSFANLQNLYDFRTGTSKDRQGNGPDLLQAGDAPPIRYSSLFLTDVFDRVGGTGRVFSRAASLPGAYSISAILSIDALSTAMMLLGNTGVSGVDRFTFQISNTGQLVVGHGLTPQISVAIPGLAVTTKMQLGVTYDGTTLRAYKNGVELANAAAAAPNPATTLYLGANEGTTFAAPFAGDFQSLAIYNAALSAPQMLELYNATYA